MPDEDEVQSLKIRIDELELEMENKDREMFGYLEKIETLEDNVMRLEALVPDAGEKGKGKGKDSKIAIELDAREKEIRELKNKMGYLRKEKIQLQQELEKIAKEKNKSSSVIRIEEKKTPLDDLVKDLQQKINKQRLLITKLKQKSIGSAEFNEEIRIKEEEVENLKTKITELEEKLEKASTAEGKPSDAITKGLTEELQNKLNRSKRVIEDLKKKLAAYEKKGGKKEKKGKEDAAADELREKIDELKEEIDTKNKEITNLQGQISSLKEAESGAPSKDQISALTEDLQSKLNKAKSQIKTLQDELSAAKKGKKAAASDPKQQEQIASLQQQIQESQQALSQKEGELGALRGEATQSKIKCEDLENQVVLKQQKIDDLLNQLQSAGTAQVIEKTVEDPQVALRLRELKSLVDDLNKQNIQQRLEISQLRNT